MIEASSKVTHKSIANLINIFVLISPSVVVSVVIGDGDEVEVDVEVVLSSGAV